MALGLPVALGFATAALDEAHVHASLTEIHVPGEDGDLRTDKTTVDRGRLDP